MSALVPALPPPSTGLLGRATLHLEDTAWLGELVRAQRALLMRVARREGLRGEAAVEAIQAAMLRLVEHRAWHPLARGPRAPRLLVALVGNAARATPRQARRRTLSLGAVPAALELAAAGAALEVQLVEAEVHLTLTGCPATLRELRRQVVAARLFEGATGQAVAERLGLPPAHVALLLHRGRAALRTGVARSRGRMAAA